MRRILAFCIATVTLAACAPGTTSGGGGEQVDDKTLTYLYFTDGPDEQATRNLIADYEKKSGVKVDLQIVPFDNLEQRLQARLSGGNAPDVARLTDISPFRSDLLDLNTFQKAALDDQFIDGADAYTKGPGGELLAVPSDLTMNGPLVNVDQFKKAGVSLPDVTKPWKWDEMVAAAQKVQKANKTQYAIAMDVSGHRFSTMLSQFGTAFFSADGTAVGLDTQKATAAVKLFAELNTSGVMPADLWLQAGSKYKAANEIFLAQQTPVYLTGNWQVSAFAKDAKFTWAAAPNPCQETCGGFPGGKFTVSFKQSKRQQAAADFIAYMNSKESQERLAKEANFLPTRKDLISSGIDYPQRDADMKVFLADVSRTPPQDFATAYSPAFAATAKAAVGELGKVLAKSESPEQAVEAINAAAEKALKDTK
ncbi:ABC transporter substrate-binding protein [Nonomuraea basaltis]|uniref:ABC transporter substrate-binding protein n=1 Tax=Nonomuraea basaltis TaxID=2495887 RepID=UPI00110C420E|nr:sugar ABC transporter substrate-binding protein [Nonomuraea basaltis]TMR98002.1 sugar ABC transporter substrate-binding protein [Nonomuraea basaltis]